MWIVGRFSKFFHQLIRQKILYVYTQRFPPYLQHICCYTTSWKSKI